MALSFGSAASTTVRRFSGTAAVALMAAAYAVTPAPTIAKDRIPTVCPAGKGQSAQLDCGIDYWRGRKEKALARSADAKARGAAADARAAVSDTENACLDLIMSDIKANGTKTANLTEPPKKGEACKLARTLKLTAG